MPELAIAISTKEKQFKYIRTNKREKNDDNTNTFTDKTKYDRNENPLRSGTQ